MDTLSSSPILISLNGSQMSLDEFVRLFSGNREEMSVVTREEVSVSPLSIEFSDDDLPPNVSIRDIFENEVDEYHEIPNNQMAYFKNGDFQKEEFMLDEEDDAFLAAFDYMPKDEDKDDITKIFMQDEEGDALLADLNLIF